MARAHVQHPILYLRIYWVYLFEILQADWGMTNSCLTRVVTIVEMHVRTCGPPILYLIIYWVH